MKYDNFILGIGVQKAGTTLLYDLLSKHQSLDIGKNKELHYFDYTNEPSLQEYLSLFNGKSRIKFDVTPSYIFYKDTMDKIAKTLPVENTKLIILLRDPIKRAESHYYMSLLKGRDNLSFKESFYKERERMQLNDLKYRENSYFERGKYYSQVKKVYELFPKENILIILFEEFVNNQQGIVDEFCDFAGISHIPITKMHSNKGYLAKNKNMNKLFYNHKDKIKKFIPPVLRGSLSKYYRIFNRKELKKEPIDNDFRVYLKSYYKNDLKSLESLIDKDLSIYYSGE